MALKTVVSEIGEHWSPKTLPSITAAKQIVMNSIGLDRSLVWATAHANGIANGKATAYVPQLVPVENAIIIVNNCKQMVITNMELTHPITQPSIGHHRLVVKYFRLLLPALI